MPASQKCTTGDTFTRNPQVGLPVTLWNPQSHGVRVAASEADRLRKLSKERICPNCGRLIPEGKSVVRGAGVFCGLECVADYHSAEFSERAKRLAAVAAQHRDS
jgi:hypothetical protein